MANPRQRRKARSNHKPVRHSNRAKRNLKKMPPLRAPKALRDAWDPKLTVKQNYARLGLMSTLNPRAKGGEETHVKPAGANRGTETEEENKESIPAIPKGYGRIIRDAEGNIVDVQMEEDDSEGNRIVLDEDNPIVVDEETERWLGRHSGNSESTALIQGLESLSKSAVKVPRTASGGEKAWLKDVIAKYGDDLERAALDRKLNPWQRTAAEIKRSIAKAGGKERLVQG